MQSRDPPIHPARQHVLQQRIVSGRPAIERHIDGAEVRGNRKQTVLEAEVQLSNADGIAQAEKTPAVAIPQGEREIASQVMSDG